MLTRLVLPILLAATPTYAHDYWANGKAVPDWVKSLCCGPADAHLLEPDQVHQNKAGDYYFTGPGAYKGIVSAKRVLPSQDGHYWAFYACVEPTCIVYCFFVPMDF